MTQYLLWHRRRFLLPEKQSVNNFQSKVQYLQIQDRLTFINRCQECLGFSSLLPTSYVEYFGSNRKIGKQAACEVVQKLFYEDFSRVEKSF